MLNDNELSSIRNQFAETFLTQTATITRKSGTGTDAFGSPTEERVTVGTAACAVHSSEYSAQSKAQEAGARETLFDEVQMEFPVGTDIQQDDVVIVGGVSYQIISINDYRQMAFSVKCLGFRLRTE